MSTTVPFPPPASGALAVIRHGLGEIRPQHVAIALALALAWGLANAVGWWLSDGTRHLPTTIAHFVCEASLTMLLLVVTVAVAHSAARGNPAAIAPYAVAAITAAIAGELIFTVAAPLLGLATCSCSMDRLEPAVRRANMLPDSLLICGFVTAGFRYRQRTSQRLARIRARELERAQITRRMVESRLQTMQACIEPQFLFDTLGDVEKLHRSEPRTAVRLIDELIVYLRAALPHLRESNSTVAKEAELAHAWLNIRRLRTGGGPALTVDLGAQAGAARLPPMILLPLVDHILSEPVTSPHATLDVAANIRDGRLRIALALRDAGRARAGRLDTLSGLRDRLSLLYGRDARLAEGSAPDGAITITLDVPHEATHGDHR